MFCSTVGASHQRFNQLTVLRAKDAAAVVQDHLQVAWQIIPAEIRDFHQSATHKLSPVMMSTIVTQNSRAVLIVPAEAWPVLTLERLAKFPMRCIGF